MLRMIILVTMIRHKGMYELERRWLGISSWYGWIGTRVIWVREES